LFQNFFVENTSHEKLIIRMYVWDLRKDQWLQNVNTFDLDLDKYWPSKSWNLHAYKFNTFSLQKQKQLWQMDDLVSTFNARKINCCFQQSVATESIMSRHLNYNCQQLFNLKHIFQCHVFYIISFSKLYNSQLKHK